MITIKKLALIASAILAVSVVAVMAAPIATTVDAAAVDFFLQIDGVKGSSNASGHAGAIEVNSWSFGASQLGTSSTGTGGGSGKVAFNDFHFTRKVDKASPVLFKAGLDGTHLGNATFMVRLTGSKEYTTVKLSDVVVSSYGVNGTTESVSLNFTKIEYSTK